MDMHGDDTLLGIFLDLMRYSNSFGYFFAFTWKLESVLSFQRDAAKLA